MRQRAKHRRPNRRTISNWYVRLLATCLLDLLRDDTPKQRQYAKRLLKAVYQFSYTSDDPKPKRYAERAINDDDDPFDVGMYGRGKLHPPSTKSGLYQSYSKGFKPEGGEETLV